MSHRTLFTLALLLGLLLPAAATAAPARDANFAEKLASPESISSGPCAPGAAYDPACDVDHDGDVDVLDVQLAAGHWNQSGAYVGDNNHNHLGQTWWGDTPLTLNGFYGAPPYYAPLILNNPAGDGLYVDSTGSMGMTIFSAGYHGVNVHFAAGRGVNVGYAAEDGMTVYAAGSPSSIIMSDAKNGFEVAGAQNNGLYVGRADQDGVHVLSAGGIGVNLPSTNSDGLNVGASGASGVYVGSAAIDGVAVNSAGGNGFSVNSAVGRGVRVGSAGSDGVYVGTAGGHGVYAVSTSGSHNGIYGINTGGGNGVQGNSVGASTSGVYGQNAGWGYGVAGRVLDGGRAIYGDGGWAWAGWFDGNVTIDGVCVGCSQANFAVNRGPRALRPGDVVGVIAIASTEFDNAHALWEVLPAEPGQAAVGVVAGGATLVNATDHLPAASGQELLPDVGAAAPGEYLTIVFSGPMQVRLASDVPAIAAGERVTAGADGGVRALQTRTVDGMVVAEGAPVLGVALADAVDGLVWVLVNPQ